LTTDPGLVEADRALLDLLLRLKEDGYRFVTPTPATHARVVARAERREAQDIAGALGWSLPFRREVIDRRVVELLEASGAIEADGALCRATLRVSSLHERLYLHSAYPTDAEDSVFFGPDSYRFADLIAAELSRCLGRDTARIVDIGTGAGVGAVVAATACPGATVTMTDVNPAALRLARINALAAGVEVRPIETGDLSPIADDIDIALANPPYIIDTKSRTYRDGGGMHGAEVSLDMARMAVERLAPGGRLILYTGSAIIDGSDPLRQALDALCERSGCTMRYRELDPDVFGEELETPAYRDVDRIALVAAVIARRD
jgi:methylase of polypeptide subunit release factors